MSIEIAIFLFFTNCKKTVLFMLFDILFLYLGIFILIVTESIIYIISYLNYIVLYWTPVKFSLNIFI